MFLSKCLVCNNEKLKFIKEQKDRGFLSSLGLRMPLSQIPLLGPLLFKKYKMKKRINKVLLEGDKFMLELG